MDSQLPSPLSLKQTMGSSGRYNLTSPPLENWEMKHVPSLKSQAGERKGRKADFAVLHLNSKGRKS